MLLTSANPHDGSSAHTNTALRVDTRVWQDVIESEKAVVTFSGNTFIEPVSITDSEIETTHLGAQLLTEKSIKETILRELETLGAGDSFDMAMFYFSDRDVVQALKDADTRGVRIRVPSYQDVSLKVEVVDVSAREVCGTLYHCFHITFFEYEEFRLLPIDLLNCLDE